MNAMLANNGPACGTPLLIRRALLGGLPLADHPQEVSDVLG